MRRALFIAVFGKIRSIALSGTTVVDNATIGTAVGTASVINGSVTGTASWSLTNNAGGKYAINSSTGAVTVNGALVAGTDTITIAVSGLTPAVKSASFTVGVVSAPVNSVLPVITGTAAVGFTLSSSTGTWSNGAYNTYTYQWKADASNIGGATSSTYVPVSGDTGKVITCAVTATNIAGNATATSAATSAVINTPANTVLPVISGSASPGQTVTTSNGTWSGSPSFTYQWKLDASPIVGQTASSYLVQAGDNTHTLTCTVTATNVVGSASATSTGVVVSTFPSGAAGAWYADAVQSSPRQYIPNDVAPGAPLSLLNGSREFGSSSPWGGVHITVTDDAVAGPDGNMRAATLVASASDWYLVGSVTLPVGTYTIACSAKRNTGTDQTFCFTTSSTSSIKTATSAWQRFSYTFTLGSPASINPGLINDGSTAANLQIDNLELFLGSSDLGAETRTGFMVFQDNAFVTQPPCSGGILDLSGSAKYGLTQFLANVDVSSGFTAVVLAEKTGASSGFVSVLSSKKSFTDFGPYLEIGGTPLIEFSGSTDLTSPLVNWDLQGEGWHTFAFRYDLSLSELFLDGGKLLSVSNSKSAPTIRDFFVSNLVDGSTYGQGWKFNAIAFWPRVLSDNEIQTALSSIRARATVSSISQSAIRTLSATGDSITIFGDYWQLSAPTHKVQGGLINPGGGLAVADAVAALSRYQALVPASPVSGTKIILSSLLGFHDIANGHSAATYLADYASWCDSIRAAGITLVIGTLLPSTSVGFNPVRNTANTTLRTWVGTHCDAVADYAANATIGTDAAASDVGLYPDGIHPTATVYAIMKPILQAQVDAL